MKKANKKFKYAEYEVSKELYEKLLEKDYNVGEVNFKIAESYRLSNRIKESEEYYKAAIDANYKTETALLHYAQALKNNEKYNEAKQVLDNFFDIAENEELLERANLEMESLTLIRKIKNMESFFRVKNLEEINTSSAEYSPVYLDGELYFTSNRYGGKIFKTTGTPLTDIYKVKTQGAVVDTTTIEVLGSGINSDNANEGTITFSPDGKTMIFAKGNSGRRKGRQDVDLYMSTFRRSGWTEPRPMRLNEPKAWDSSPAFSLDGNAIIFSSNRKGGYGGTDLYMATRTRRGRFSDVRNLGSDINTAGNEMFPHIAVTGDLYFSSNGHPGLGGLDIFVATRRGGEQIVENLGAPVNSSSDDFGIFLYSPTKGFFTSNRIGGKGDDDIYTFINSDPDLKIVNYYLAGTVYTLDDENKEQPLANSYVKIFSAGESQPLNEVLTGRDGKFFFRVYPEEDYRLVAEKENYLANRNLFSTKGKTVPKEELTQLVTNKTFTTKIRLDKIVIDKAIVMENIYYDLDKWDIRDDAARELDKLVTLLQDNPEIKIELSSHTDSRQTADYNLELSKKRAQSAVDYIVSKGVNPSRIVAKGYGESQLIISDPEIAKLETPEAKERAHQRNRRTEFKVIEYNKIEEPAEDETAQNEEEEEEAQQPGNGLIIQESIDASEDLENKIDWDN